MKPEKALEKISSALFPTPRKERGGHLIDSDAYYNLEGALIDLKRTKADPVCIKTIERVQKQIHQVSRILIDAGVK
ncbi:hypothetical protein [Hyphomicrobium sp.]|uniref:hypothetical protein n=1 Tax=Hyphomicrobium sp. TaxID=82 RepID=UPI001DEF0B78|nr:hypothetical protein [Hyphomicrobium sp.]MBY0561528.1 hypothetical protein [Hyphomicrobium sp.]